MGAMGDGCINKRRYRTEDEARQAAERTNRENPQGSHVKAGWYRCARCRFWHVGRRRPSSRRPSIGRHVPDDEAWEALRR